MGGPLCKDLRYDPRMIWTLRIPSLYPRRGSCGVRGAMIASSVAMDAIFKVPSAQHESASGASFSDLWPPNQLWYSLFINCGIIVHC